MAVKKKEKKEGSIPLLCAVCDQEIYGDHVRIKTKRRTELHIHYRCMNTGGKRDGRYES